jgi:hypothetical protein
LCEALERPSNLLNFGAFPMRVGEAMVSYGDNTKAKTLLNWVPGDIPYYSGFLGSSPEQ